MSKLKLFNYVRLLCSYVRLNLTSEYEYRAAFWSQVIAMVVNDCCWLSFWVLFFQRFPVLNDWTINDVITLWAVVAGGFGLAHGFFGNALALPSIIARGGLDTWMVYPRAVLPHLLMGKTHVTSWGDMIFGVVAYLVMVQPDALHFLLFLTLLSTVAITFVGFSVFSGSLAFFLGNSQVLSEQWRFALVTFSTYPPGIFDGAIKLVLYTLIPAAFVGYLPVEALKHFSLCEAGLCFLGSVIFLTAGGLAFSAGLRRYESGNLTEMRG